MPPVTPVFPLRRALALAAAALVAATTAVVIDGPAARAAMVEPDSRYATRVIDGPDVASYQHPYGQRILWHKVAKAGHEFAIVKATEGGFYRNPWFSRDYRGAREAGLARGAYHFARPAYPLVETARAQARYFAAALGATPQTSRTMPPALDLEVTGGLGRGALVIWAQEFLLATRQLTGRTPMIYTYPSFWTSALGDPAALERFPLWMASYSGPVDDSATLWQYTAGATVRGIHGHVDMSRLVAERGMWPTLSDGTAPSPWPATVPGRAQRVHADPAAGRATVSWMPGDPGSNPIDHYRVTAWPSGETRTVPATRLSADFDGLHNGTPYTFTVDAFNKHGGGLVTAPSDAVTPMIPTALTVADAPATTYGHDAHVRLRFTRPDTGAALRGRAIEVEQRVAGTHQWLPWRTVTTTKHGWTSLTLQHPDQALALRYSYAGTKGVRSTERIVPVAVHNGVSARLSTHRVRSGHPVVVRGRIAPGIAGVTVRREAYVHGGWRVLQTSTTGANGAYAFTFHPQARHRAVRQVRVVVAGFDHRSRGYSAARSVAVHH